MIHESVVASCRFGINLEGWESVVRLEDVIGQNVRLRRQEKGWSQTTLGQQLVPYLGVAWTPQAVSNAEKGGRAFGATDLMALAYALQSTVAMLLAVPKDAEIETPGGIALDTTKARGLVQAGVKPQFRTLKQMLGAQAHLQRKLTQELSGTFAEAMNEALDKVLDKAVKDALETAIWGE